MLLNSPWYVKCCAALYEAELPPPALEAAGSLVGCISVVQCWLANSGIEAHALRFKYVLSVARHRLRAH